ncbi:MAG: hypothetical protein ABIK83_03005 [Candidatus Zixiibacteriota bacterium]
MNKSVLTAVAAFFALLIVHAFASVPEEGSANSGFKRVLYTVELDKSVLNKPALAIVWRQYGELKVKWRTEIFRERFPEVESYHSTFEEEYECRKFLAEKWEELQNTRASHKDAYLENLVKVKNSRYFREYIYSYFKKGSWNIDKDKLYLDEFKKWREMNMSGPKKETHVELKKIELAEW